MTLDYFLDQNFDDFLNDFGIYSENVNFTKISVSPERERDSLGFRKLKKSTKIEHKIYAR